MKKLFADDNNDHTIAISKSKVMNKNNKNEIIETIK